MTGEFQLQYHINRGFCRINNGNIEEAINDFEDALYFDQKCLKEYPNMFKSILESLKNIIRIHFQIKV